MLRSVRADQANVRPIGTGIRLKVAILINQPMAIWRPARYEIEMLAMRGNQNAVGAQDIASPDLVSLRAGQVVGHPAAIGTDAQAVGKPFTHARELPGVSAVQVHAVDLAAL